MTDPSDEIRRKRLRFQSWHRGTKEADLLLGSFADAHLPDFNSAQLDTYDALLAQNDADLWDWLIARHDPPPEHDTDVMRLLRAFRYTVGPA